MKPVFELSLRETFCAIQRVVLIIYEPLELQIEKLHTYGILYMCKQFEKTEFNEVIRDGYFFQKWQ